MPEIIKNETLDDDTPVQINIMYGVKEFIHSIWKVKRIKGKRSWLNWFPEDYYEMSTEYVTMTGDKHMLYGLMMCGAKWEWDNG